MKFDVKPDRIDAIQFKYTEERMRELVDFVSPLKVSFEKGRFYGAKGTMQLIADCKCVQHIVAYEGSWVIKHDDGSIGSMPTETFEAKYQEAEIPEIEILPVTPPRPPNKCRDGYLPCYSKPYVESMVDDMEKLHDYLYGWNDAIVDGRYTKRYVDMYLGRI